jgi:hypothetical protein
MDEDASTKGIAILAADLGPRSYLLLILGSSSLCYNDAVTQAQRRSGKLVGHIASCPGAGKQLRWGDLMRRYDFFELGTITYLAAKA